ncbi:MAG TPA: hypothetical protein VMR16_04120 [Candidatus Saccharimonadales bacterium]|jgi:hypothetical protein|nr:hypothetical protein [Candidatus Saccharimonadales bacterium]
MKVNVTYDISKDEENYNYSLVDKAYPSYGRDKMNILTPFASELQIKLDSTLNSEMKNKIIKDYIKNTYLKHPLLKLSTDTLSKSWGSISDAYIDKLYKYFQIEDSGALPVTCYLTTLGLCPYNRKQRYFYVPFYASIADQIHVIMHELMHIVFLDNYEQYLLGQGVSEQGILDINESLIVLLNLEFKEFLLVKAVNKKPSTYDLQDIVKEEYEKSTPFKTILQKLIASRLPRS